MQYPEQPTVQPSEQLFLQLDTQGPIHPLHLPAQLFPQPLAPVQAGLQEDEQFPAHPPEQEFIPHPEPHCEVQLPAHTPPQAVVHAPPQAVVQLAPHVEPVQFEPQLAPAHVVAHPPAQAAAHPLEQATPQL